MIRNHYYKFHISLISTSYHLKQECVILPIDSNIEDLKKRINSILIPENKQELIVYYKNKELLNNVNLKYYFDNTTNVYNLIVYRNTYLKKFNNFLKMFF